MPAGLDFLGRSDIIELTKDERRYPKMTNNTALFKSMIDRYNSVAFTHNYIFGFAENGNIIACFAKSDVLPHVLKLDRASRGNGMSLRFKPTKNQREVLKLSKRQKEVFKRKNVWDIFPNNVFQVF